ncbi:MAG: hypothetical protein IT457_13010 [Planctomycetes bacterium]|nr:hypothetical protein [Planctomycetota bacterium]
MDPARALLPAIRLVRLGLLLAAAANAAGSIAAQVEWQRRLPWRHGREATLRVDARPGDEVVLELSLEVGPGGPSPTTLRWSTASGQRGELQEGQAADTIRYRIRQADDLVRARIDNWDSDDSALLRVGIERRANLSVSGPRIEADQSVSFGYQVGDRSWDPYGHNVGVVLYYSDGKRPLGAAIRSSGLLLAAQSQGSIQVPRHELPPMPPKATGFMALVDVDDRIPESDECDNRAFTELPALCIEAPRYDRSGAIAYGYRNCGSVPARTRDYVTVELRYARGPSLADVLPDVPAIHSSPIELQPGKGARFKLRPGKFALPPAEATHVVAAINAQGLILEADRADNVAALPVQVAPGFARVAAQSGVSVLRGRHGGREVHVVILDLTRSTLGSLVSRDPVGPQHIPWQTSHFWDRAAREQSGSLTLLALVNGTFFWPDWWERMLSGGGNVFTPGLKAGGKTFNAQGDGYLLAYGERSPWCSLIRHSAAAFASSDYPNLVGVSSLRAQRSRTAVTARTWVAMRDVIGKGPRREKRHGTLIFFVTESANVRDIGAITKLFGCSTSTAALLPLCQGSCRLR